MNFLHSFQPEAILVTIGPLTIHWYGLLIVLGLLAGFLVTFFTAKKKQVDVSYLYSLFFYFIIFGILGGRLVHVLGDWSYYGQHAASIPRVWDGGIALHGVLLGCLVALAMYTKVRRLSFWTFADLFALGAPLAQAIGRWGNYFNQELYGKPTDVQWGIPIDLEKRIIGYEQYAYFHPLFLYESILNIILFFVLLVVMKSKRVKKGEILLFYVAGYSAIRFFLDFLRIEPLSLGPLSVVQWVSIVLILGSLFALILYRSKSSVTD